MLEPVLHPSVVNLSKAICTLQRHPTKQAPDKQFTSYDLQRAPLSSPLLALLTKTHTGRLWELEWGSLILVTHPGSSNNSDIYWGLSYWLLLCNSQLYQFNSTEWHGELPDNWPKTQNAVFINYDRAVPWFPFSIGFYHQITLHSNSTLHFSSQIASLQYSHLQCFQLYSWS